MFFSFNFDGLFLSNFGIQLALLLGMSVDLAELNKIEGVADAFIYTKWGELLLPQLSYKDSRIDDFGREAALCSALLEKMKQDVDFFELIFEDRHIIVRISQSFFILVVCEDRADTTLIKLTLNVILEETKGDKDIQKSLRKSPGKKDILAEAQEESELRGFFENQDLKVEAAWINLRLKRIGSNPLNHRKDAEHAKTR